jgi:hypothetical protein
VENRANQETDQLTYTLRWQGAEVTGGFFMAANSKLPSRFPVGTKFVIEGRRGGGGVQVVNRYLEFPDGTFFPLPARPMPAQLKPKAPISRRQRMRRGHTAKG